MRTWLACFVLAASTLLHAQAPPASAPPAPAEQGPTFRTGVDVITIDVSVVDPGGQPVTDLRAPDFLVRIDGQPRRVVSVEAIRFDAAPAQPGPSPQPFESFFSTNQGAPASRLIVLAVDQLNIQVGSARQLLQSAGRFLDSLAPSDRVAFFAYPAPGVAVDFTTDRARIRKAMDTVVGAAQPYEAKFNIGLFEAVQSILRNNEMMQEAVVARECRRLSGTALDECTRQVLTEMALMVNRVREERRRSLGGLEQMLAGLALVDAPKSVLLMSEGLVLEDQSDVESVVRAAARARASINVLMMDVMRGGDVSRGAVMPPTMTEDRQMQTGGLRELAAASRGTLYNVFGNGATIFDRLSSELSAYYLIGVEEEAGDRNDQAHRIDVEVRRQGVQVRSRRAFVLAPPRVRPPSESLAELLRAPFGVAEVPLRVTTFAVQDPSSGKVRMLVAADVDQAGSAPADYTVGWVLIDGDGRVTASGSDRQTLQPSSVAGALVFRTEALVDPGVYSLRLAVVDPAGRRGALVREVNAWKMADEEFAVADLVVGAPPTSGQVVLASVEPQVDAELAAVLELYSTNPAVFASTSVAFEVADDVEAPALVTSAADIVDGAQPTSRTAQAVIPTRAIPPGRYVVRARLVRNGSVVGLLSRPFVLRGPAGGQPALLPAVILASPALTPPFDRAAAEAPELRTSLLADVERRWPSLGPALAEARAGRYGAAALEALGAGNQDAAAFLKGLEFFTRGQFEQAATQLNVAAGPRREFFAAAFYLGASLAALGRDRDAASVWQLAIGNEPRPAQVYVHFADARLRDGQPQSVVDVLEGVWQRTPTDTAVGRRLATALARTGRTFDALPVFEQYLARHPDDQEVLVSAILAQYEASTRSGLALSERERTRLTGWARAYTGPERALIDRYVNSVR